MNARKQASNTTKLAVANKVCRNNALKQLKNYSKKKTNAIITKSKQNETKQVKKLNKQLNKTFE